jgi:Relaxase/Mobilisation nuclease domain
MIAKGNLHSDGAGLARYMTTAKEGERVERAGLYGFATDDIYAALYDVELEAASKTRCENPFFHLYLRAKGEHLTKDEWFHCINRSLDALGFGGQPHAIAFHIDERTGERHPHVAVSRIAYDREDDKFYSIDPGLWKNKCKEVCRELENELGLRRVSSERENKAAAPDRNEFEEARRLGTGLKDTRETIRDCFERCDNGQSFKAALEEEGFVLAQGDRRNCFVVIDQEGGHHALNKKLTGMKLAEIRERLADINPEQLPSVEQGRAQQLERGLTRAEQDLEQSGLRPTPEPERSAPAAPKPEPPREEIHIERPSAAQAASQPMRENHQQHNPEQAHSAGAQPSTEAEAKGRFDWFRSVLDAASNFRDRVADAGRKALDDIFDFDKPNEPTPERNAPHHDEARSPEEAAPAEREQQEWQKRRTSEETTEAPPREAETTGRDPDEKRRIEETIRQMQEEQRRRVFENEHGRGREPER